MDKKSALADLLQSKFIHDRITARADASRRTKLATFLAQYKHASQWATCCAALEDAVCSNVTPSDAMICDAIHRCGQRGKMEKAKDLYFRMYRRIGRPRSMAAHVTFMSACAACGDFKEAYKQYHRLWKRDVALLEKTQNQHRPVVTDDLTTEYLRSALASMVAGRATESGDPAPWETALGDFMAVRRHPALRPHNSLTPLLVESAVLLAEVGKQPSLCLRILESCTREQALVPPEAYDAALRACFRDQRHYDVVSLMSQLIATKTSPDERSVRLALVSSEEVAAADRASGACNSSVGRAAWDLSLTLFHAMQHNGLPLYQQSYEAPLRACAMAGQWEAALTMVHTMRRDGRPVSTELYRVSIAARVEVCKSYQEVTRFLEMPVVADGSPSVVVYLAALRCLLHLGDFKHFEQVNRMMKDRDMPESYEKIRILIEAAYKQGLYHSVLMRFARFDNITTYEKQRVGKDQLVRQHDADFAVSDRLLDMVLDAYEKVKCRTDPMVEVAYRAAIRRKQDGAATQLKSSSVKQAPEWMYSAEVRDKRAPSPYQ